ncbi:hypothetical protein LPJGGPFB_03245 [Ensifer adhaerens]|uniref:jacalin-like lectin n=1 Tax=Ensifer adhaerens TaxID=106592 RepID=UPI001569B693|nr:hypothetical protein [Ensifer adhaerens]NRP19986.1 hypothetical protein [Ensifer adhaerens]
MVEYLEKIYPIGGKGGAPFQEQKIKEIGLSTGSFVDAIYINGVRNGGQGGIETPRLVLSSDEIITSMEVRSGGYIDYLKFTTNKGRWIAGGGPGGMLKTFENIQLIAIGGRAGLLVDYLEFRMLIDSTIHPKPS